MRIDGRIPVRLGALETAAPDEALLLTEAAADPGGHAVARVPAASHPMGCACCLPRNGAAHALTLLFLRRVRGEVPPFRAVLAALDGADADALRAALADDPLASARFRLV